MSGQTAAAAAATAVAAVCTVIAARRAAAPNPRRPAFIAWTIGFALFTVAAAALWLGAANGWTDAVFRVDYLTGGILVVAYLAVGELLLVLPGRRVTRMAAATMLFVTFAAVAAVLAARVDAAALARAGATPPNDALEGTWPKVMAIACHAYMSGSPHRIRHLERAIQAIVQRPGVVVWSGSQILDWYLGQTGSIARPQA